MRRERTAFGLLSCWCVEQLQSVHRVVREEFSIVTDLNHENLSGALALMFTAIFVAATKTEAIGASKIAQLPLATVAVAAGSWW